MCWRRNHPFVRICQSDVLEQQLWRHTSEPLRLLALVLETNVMTRAAFLHLHPRRDHLCYKRISTMPNSC
jgi:hypothetical protein